MKLTVAYARTTAPPIEGAPQHRIPVEVTSAEVKEGVLHVRREDEPGVTVGIPLGMIWGIRIERTPAEMNAMPVTHVSAR